MSRLLNPQLSFADLQLQSLGIHLDPSLQGIAGFLEKHSTLVELVRLDLDRGLTKPNAGRRGITPEQTLRSLTLMRVKNWDYRELRERINDGYTLRGFTRFDSHAVPKHDAFNRAFNRLTPATMAAINFLEPTLRGRHTTNRGARPGRRQATPRRYHGGGNQHPSPHRCHLVVGHRAHHHASGRRVG